MPPRSSCAPTPVTQGPGLALGMLCGLAEQRMTRPVPVGNLTLVSVPIGP
jgi:hypothetical protein